jgi:uncharacterized membrane protein (DUF106 family)
VTILILGLLVGFALGYTLRDLMSERRQAAAQQDVAEPKSQERALSRQQQVDRLKRMAELGSGNKTEGDKARR